MLKVADREEQGYLSVDSIEKFPCEDLRIIDRLWVKYSDGKFGFSVQKDIYESLGGTKEYNEQIWLNFCDRIGWREERGRNWQKTYTTKAPLAHLPRLEGRGGRLVGSRVRNGVYILFSRAKTCNL